MEIKHQLKLLYYRFKAAYTLFWRHLRLLYGWLRYKWDTLLQWQQRLVFGAGLLLVVAILLLLHPWPGPVVVQGDYEPFQSLTEYNAFYAKHPAMKQHPPAGSRFRVTASVSPNREPSFVIDLYGPAPKTGNDASFRNYVSVLQQGQIDAKDWLKSLGEDPQTSYIVWRPDPSIYLPSTSPTATPLPLHNMLVPTAHD